MLFWTPHFSVLDSTFFILDSIFWLDSTLKIDPAGVGEMPQLAVIAQWQILVHRWRKLWGPRPVHFFGPCEPQMCMTSPLLSTFCPSSDFTFRRYLETHLNILYCLTKLHSNFCNFCFHSAAYVSVRVETLASLFGSILLHSYSCSGEYSTELAYMNVLARSDVRHMRPCNVVSPAFIWLPTFFYAESTAPQSADAQHN